MSNHGGKREGSGRKKLLTDDQRLWVGSSCEEFWRKALKRNLDAELAERSKNSSKVRLLAQAIPIGKRREWLQKIAGQEYLEDLGFAICEDSGQVIDVNIDIKTEYHKMADTDKKPLEKIIHVKAKQPKGARKQIISDMVHIVSSRYGCAVSKGTIEKCWKEFRQLEKAIQSNV